MAALSLPIGLELRHSRVDDTDGQITVAPPSSLQGTCGMAGMLREMVVSSTIVKAAPGLADGRLRLELGVGGTGLGEALEIGYYVVFRWANRQHGWGIG